MGGGSKTTTVAAPAWLEDAAKYGLGRAEQASRIGYTPYYGPDVAAMTPMQIAGMQGTNTAAGAFGLGTADPMAGMPQAQNFNGMAAYSSGPMYDQALAELERRAPGQYAALRAPFIDPVTGGQYGASSMQGKSGSGVPVPTPAPVVSPVESGGGGGSDRGMMSSGGGGVGSSSSGTIGGYTGIRDMFDGGGPGASGTTFSGGPLSGVANAVGISPVAAARPAPVVAPTVARVVAPAPTVFTSSADRVRAANSVANNALMGKAAVQKATEVGKALQGNRAADKALAGKAQSQANKAAADKAKTAAAQGKGGKSGPSGGSKSSGGSNATRR